MMTAIIPKLPMRNKELTTNYYSQLGFEVSHNDFEGYLMMMKDTLEIHFFEFRDILPSENYGQIYIRCSDIDEIYKTCREKSVAIHPAGDLTEKPWRQKEFSLLDPDNNLITFGQALK